MKYAVEYSETTLADGSPALVVTVSGKAYENLRKIADAMNATSGLDTDNTPLSVAIGFDFAFEFERLADGGREALEQAYLISDGIDAPPAVREELAARFAALDF